MQKDKKEWMVHCWGGAFNDDANPSIKKDHNITEGYYYFADEKEKDDFLAILKEPKYFYQGLMIDTKHQYMTHKRTIFVGTFEYNDNSYILHYDFGYEYPEDMAIFQFTENNYSCDCNRSLFIQREYGKDSIPELGCGDKIKLVEYHIEYWD